LVSIYKPTGRKVSEDLNRKKPRCENAKTFAVFHFLCRAEMARLQVLDQNFEQFDINSAPVLAK
jgi:hypothetical protein